jgi:hypothetical protein
VSALGFCPSEPSGLLETTVVIPSVKVFRAAKMSRSHGWQVLALDGRPAIIAVRVVVIAK